MHIHLICCIAALALWSPQAILAADRSVDANLFIELLDARARNETVDWRGGMRGVFEQTQQLPGSDALTGKGSFAAVFDGGACCFAYEMSVNQGRYGERMEVMADNSMRRCGSTNKTTLVYGSMPFDPYDLVMSPNSNARNSFGYSTAWSDHLNDLIGYEQKDEQAEVVFALGGGSIVYLIDTRIGVQGRVRSVSWYYSLDDMKNGVPFNTKVYDYAGDEMFPATISNTEYDGYLREDGLLGTRPRLTQIITIKKRDEQEAKRDCCAHDAGPETDGIAP